MSAATQKPDENAMADDERDERDDRDDQSADEKDGGDEKETVGYRTASTRAAGAEVGFFHIYKPGQGYWTRMGTAAAAGLVAIFTCLFLYDQLLPMIPFFRSADHKTWRLGVSLGFLALAALGVFWYINRPQTADFLIATDSEMKKVNWTSRKELLGSTRVVIFFMFLIAALLFGIDIVFGYFFYGIGVLKNPPF